MNFVERELLKEFSKKFVMKFDEVMEFLRNNGKKDVNNLAKRCLRNLAEKGLITELHFLGKCYAITQEGIKALRRF